MIRLLCLALLTSPLAIAQEAPANLKAAKEAITAGDFQKALEMLEAEAVKDDPAAHFRLGEIFLRGTPGIEADPDRALFHLQSAAEFNSAEASALLGDISKTKAEAANAKPERDPHFTEARIHYEKAATLNHPAAQLKLAYLLDSGNGGAKDPARAIILMKASANSGHPPAMNELGLRYQQGLGVPRDLVTSLGWFLAGAERNNPAAMTNLGTCYARGIVVPPDHNKAGAWYARASKLNYAPAQYFLGEAFQKGHGTPANPVFAFVNFTRAARANHSKAIAALESLALSTVQKEEASKLLKETP